jgi:glycerol-3-phosphate acyltransferase PlsY
MAAFLLLLLGAYLIGAIPSGVILTRIAGAGDIRQAGSGNIGATNVYRVAGRRLGIITLVCDALKGVLPLAALLALGGRSPAQLALVAAAAFLGHCYPVYLGFKGGKGVATALGIFLVLSPLSVLGARPSSSAAWSSCATAPTSGGCATAPRAASGREAVLAFRFSGPPSD